MIHTITIQKQPLPLPLPLLILIHTNTHNENAVKHMIEVSYPKILTNLSKSSFILLLL